jgi:two-component system, OmpR family, KDP operon response regulator KdpE
VATDGAKPVVLVVDDEPAIRLLCRVNLEFEGYEVHEAGTIEAARAALATVEVALVLLDMHLGLDDGMVLLREIVSHDPRVPVAVVSGSTDIHHEDYSLADAVLGKPFTIEELTDTVRTLAAR